MDNQYVDKSSYEETLKLAKENPSINLFVWPKQLTKFKDVNDSIIYSDEFLKVWSNPQFLTHRIFHGIKARMELLKK